MRVRTLKTHGPTRCGLRMELLRRLRRGLMEIAQTRQNRAASVEDLDAIRKQVGGTLAKLTVAEGDAFPANHWHRVRDVWQLRTCQREARA